MVRWAYGVTTVPSRRDTYLPITLRSLEAGGFDRPRLFVDGCSHGDAVGYQTMFGLPVTARPDQIRTHGNWVLGIYELYIRNPESDLFAMFQDDMVTCKNVKKYLERCKLPDKGYFNLYSFPSQERFAPGKVGWYPSSQNGRGAVGLVFTKNGVMELLSARHMIDRVHDVHRGWQAVDGGISDSFKKAGWTEYVHLPGLVQHTGIVSTMNHVNYPQSRTFKGEDFDAMTLLEGT